jgi:hypothetical protein
MYDMGFGFWVFFLFSFFFSLNTHISILTTNSMRLLRRDAPRNDNASFLKPLLILMVNSKTPSGVA